jgi:hypothetical protein
MQKLWRIGKCFNKKENESKSAIVWENKNYAMLLYNYAKYRAFTCGSEAQIKRIESYFALFIFYRNMIWSSFISVAILGISLTRKTMKYNCLTFESIGMILLFLFLTCFIPWIFYHIGYKYRTYYCREVLNAYYYSKTKCI